ncbi:hypothetical protein GCM10008018_70580 [Paenibacillus marchantiophytorum]|uniref:Rpn family recombination-promoting nuclease/putative transposase n=1 Tax=Paenibacillus marchantiophytorum TaxID=1619310 RepID=A0ABQ1FI31_9BACL|nr:Rpn family recombination-promoting nuclease/putative transposase [Paenibacillus marchantiophytorum]GGA15754.1 hypothetical protein GCM10008018_70580 [Paenibacillus marchantiophytorum]
MKHTEREALSEIILVNPNLDKDSLQDKLSILDVRVKTSSGKYIDIEMQLFNKYDIEKRSLYVWSKLYEAQLSEGQKYKELNKCITINILNYSFLPVARYHSIFQLREIVTHAPLIDDIELHFIELPKLKETAVSLDEGLVKWLLFLKGTEKEKCEVLAMNEPQLRYLGVFKPE